MVDVRIVPDEVNLIIHRGDYVSFPIRVPIGGGDYFDFTDHTFLSQIRANTEATDVLATIEVTIFDNGSTDRGVILVIEDADTTVLPKKATWDFQVTDPDGHPRTWFSGKVVCGRDVSRVVTP